MTVATGSAFASASANTSYAAQSCMQIKAEAERMKIKITSVEPVLLKATRHYPCWLWVRIRTDQGIEGIGEGFAWSGRTPRIIKFVEQLGRQIVGTSAIEIEKFVQRSLADRPLETQDWGAAGSAIEIALWDILGKAVNLPVYALLGGAVRDRIPLYADHGVFAEGFDIDRILAMKAAGFGMFKWDPFKGRPTDEGEIRKQVEQVAMVREAVGPDYRLAIDAHGRFELEAAKIAAAALEPLNILFFEEPVHFQKPEWFKPIAESTSIPLSTGENITHRKEVATYLKTGALGYFQPEVGTNGGIMESVKVAAMCEPFGLKIATHDWCGPVVSRAATHVCAVIPNLLYQEWANCAPGDSWEQELLEPPTRIEDGHILLPSTPGLGFELNEKALKKRRIG